MTRIASRNRKGGISPRAHRSTRRLGGTLGKAAAAVAIGGGLSLAAVAPAQAATSNDYYQVVSHPSQHCTYYHHIVNGAWRGVSYQCTANESGDKPYRAWIVCYDDFHGTQPKYYGPTVRKPAASKVDCLVNQGPKVGGFNDPA